MLKAPKRMARISEDIVEHFNSHVKPKSLKRWSWSMIVMRVQMYYLLKEKLGKDSIEVIMNVDRAPIEVTDGNKNGKLNKDWRRWKEELKLPIEKMISNVGKN